MPPKKGGKKNKDDDWDDEAAEKKLAALNLGGGSETQWDDEEPKPKSKAKAKAPPAKKGFAALLDEESEPEQKSEDEPEPEAAPVKAAAPAKEKKEKKEKKKGGKKGKKEEDDEDLDALLAEIESKNAAPVPAPAPEPTPAPVAAAPSEEEENKKKDKKKKKKKDAKEETPEADIPESSEKPSEKSSEKPEESAEKPADQEESEGDEDGEVDKDKEKKDKKKQKKKDRAKKAKEEEKKGGTKKGTVNSFKELLRKQREEREEAERLAKEEEERAKQEEIERREREKLEKERKEEQKKAKAAEIERQKAAGTYLSAAQKRQQALALEKLRAAGHNIPVPRESTEEEGATKKSFVYVDEKTKAKQEEKKRRRLEKLGQLPAESAAAAKKGEDDRAETPSESVATTPEDEKKELTPEPIDDWEMADSGDEKEAETKKKGVKKEVKEEEEESEDEEESEGDDSEDDDSESDSEEEEEDESSDDENRGQRETKEQVMERVKVRLQKRKEAADAKRSTDNLRSPVICVLGHVDTGKTKMLDTIRRTNVQQGEAGGITQQIGATEVPAEAIKERCRQVKNFLIDQMKIPGFLIIDTPGHESFSNLRTRGSSLCDFAILVVDIMHGLEPQTIESLKLLLKGKTPFVIALNKIDRLYEYESNPRKDVYELLKSQKTRVQAEFKERYEKIVVEFAEQEVNVTLSNSKKADDPDYVCMVPTSAMLGDGIGNLMAFIVNQTQTKHAQKLAFSEELDATVMEVKQIPGLGTTIDVILVNGTMKAGDFLILTGTDGAIVTQVRELLMPKPLKELRVKNDYIHYKEVKGARGVKVLAKNLEKVLAGLPVYIAYHEDEVDYLRQEADNQLANALHAIKKKPEGVYVQASTLGSLEALLDFLKSQKIPYSNVNIGPVHKKDVQKASAMKEHKAEYACILAFDVKVEREAQIFADHEGVKVFQADIIYHLQDAFLKYREELKEKARRENEHLAIFPCKLRVLPNHVFNTRNPIVCGVAIEAGQVKRGIPICVPSKEGILLGTISSVQRNNEEVLIAKQGEEVCIKIENTTGEAPKLYGRHFTHEDALVSKITRESIDVCKTYFRDDLTKADWQLIVQLKKLLDIM
ncbi:hypothetical protein CAEBREN_04552 [Caenorhabditis brenneri]|uniref:Eukaryotic translation initiation factor 5B n=1 Tax=Caenorhabditis brenneri TaxID=135651 RepID=G0P4A3_CAEBE|nr:hypothetical protein CAEBREN_04552 [Caenorhabditis brenneri]